MDDYGISMGVPNASGVEGVSDRKHRNPENEGKKKKKEDKKKPPLISKPDEVIISSQVIPPENEDKPDDDRVKEEPQKTIGKNIDIKA